MATDTFLIIVLTALLSLGIIGSAVLFLRLVARIADRIVQSVGQHGGGYTDEAFLDDITALSSGITIIVLGYFLACLWGFL